jgi:O-antigen/teichoic acid export membrane protein
LSLDECTPSLPGALSLGKTILRNTVWSGLDTLLELVVPQILSILVARKLGPAKLGPFVYVMWISSLTMVIGDFGISSAVRKYLGDAFGKAQWGLARRLVSGAIFLQALVAGVFLVLGLCWVFLALPSSQRVYSSLAVISVLPALLMAIGTAVNSALESLAANVISSMLSVAANAVGTLLTLGFDWGLEGLAAAFLVGRCVDCAVRSSLAAKGLRAYLRKRTAGLEQSGDERIPRALQKEMFGFCFQSAVLLLLNIVVWSRSEMFFIKHYCDAEQLAFFSIAFTFAMLPKRLAAPFTFAALASLYAERGRNVERGQKVAELCVRYQALIVLPAASGLAALSGPLIRVFYGTRYAQAAPVLACAMALGAIGPLADPASNLLRAASKQHALIWWTAIAGLGVLVLDWALVRSYSAVGGAIANGIGQSAFTMGVFWLATRQHGFRTQSWYLARVLTVSCAMAISVAFLSVILPDVGVLFIGPALGVAVFLTGLRYGRVFNPEDGNYLPTLGAMVPRRYRPISDWVLAWLRLNSSPQDVN